MNDLIARRIGRVIFGYVLLAGAGCLVATHLAGRMDGWSTHFDATRIVVCTWLAALLAGRAARRIAAGRVLRGRQLPGAPYRLFADSIVVPALGIALLLPLTLHMPVALLIGGREGFNEWVCMSLWITGLAHVVFACMVAGRAYQLVTGGPAWSPARIHLVTVLTSCVPFVVLFAIPPVLVAITAAMCFPLLFKLDRVVAREREELARCQHALPRAIAVSRPRP